MMRSGLTRCRLLLAATLLLSITGRSQLAAQLPPSGGTSEFNVVAPTFGGTQFWTDRHYQGGWRIQQNSETGHFRLLDRKNFRQAWGKRSDCEDALQSQILSGNVVPDQGRLVILLHGLLRSSDSMEAMSKALRKHGLTTIDFSYASSRGSVQSHAAALGDVINGLGDGGQSQQQSISNVLLPGSDDFTVSVEETKLAGASDFLVAPLLHTTMMRDNDAIAWTINFLKHGYFKTPNNRNPLPR